MRFFVEGAHAAGEVVALAGGDARKIRTVLRMSEGDRLEIVDSRGCCFTAELRLKGRTVEAVLIEAQPPALGRSVRVAIAQAIPKAQKMDFVVEKLTELGVAEIIPFRSERSIPDAREHKIERWRRLAKSAAQQSGRLDVPAVREAVAFADVVQSFERYDCVLFPWELAPQRALREVLPPLLLGRSRIIAVIGPEGGFSHAEAAGAQEAGAHCISLGRRILRTETAGLTLLAIVNYLTAG